MKFRVAVVAVIEDALEDESVGAVVSMTIAWAPAILLLPVGTVVEDIMFPDGSVGALVSTYELTVKSALVLPAPTV